MLARRGILASITEADDLDYGRFRLLVEIEQAAIEREEKAIGGLFRPFRFRRK